jgi:predicted Zn-dependent peptidase
MWDPYSEFQSAVLLNGLTIHSAHWPGRPWEAVGFLIHSGAKHDPVGLEGLAHFVEHLISCNSEVSKNDIKVFFDDFGGNVNLGMTGYINTEYRFFVPADKAVLSRAFSMFGKMLLSSSLEKSIERERKVIFGEFNLRYPFRHKFELATRAHKAIYPGDWLERFTSPLGSPESVGLISEGDLQSYYDTHYTPANISIVCVGGMKLAELVEIISESSFSIQKKGTRTLLPIPLDEVSLPSETCHVEYVSKYTTSITEVIQYESIAKIPGKIDSCVVRFVAEILDKLLNEEVREKRAWTYSIGSL